MNNIVKKIHNCEKENSAALIINALIWAAVLIISSWLTRGTEHADTLFIIILSASTAAFLFTDRQRKNK